MPETAAYSSLLLPFYQILATFGTTVLASLVWVWFYGAWHIFGRFSHSRTGGASHGNVAGLAGCNAMLGRWLCSGNDVDGVCTPVWHCPSASHMNGSPVQSGPVPSPIPRSSCSWHFDLMPESGSIAKPKPKPEANRRPIMDRPSHLFLVQS